MTFRRSLLTACATAVAAMAFLPIAAQAQSMVLKAADVHPAGYPNGVAVENMGKKLEAATQGRLKIQTFPGGVLGGEKEMIEQTQFGAINILRTSLGPVGTVVPEVNVFNMPFVFRSQDHMRAVIDGAIGDELLAKISASPAKLVAIGWMDGGSRSLYTKKPVRTPADLKGQKVRMMGNPLFVDTMNAMGGNGISMGYGEVFTALQTGVVDGAENNAPSFFTSNHYSTGTESPIGIHYQFRQTYRNIPIYRTQIQVNLDKKGNIGCVTENTYDTSKGDLNALFNGVTKGVKQKTILSFAKDRQLSPESKPEEMIFFSNENTPIRVLQFTASKNNPATFNEYLMDGLGNIIYIRDLHNYSGNHHKA